MESKERNTVYGVDRRLFLQSGAAAAGLFVTSACSSSGANTASAEPLVETTNGPIRGAILDGVRTFKGVPYGASTAGANRFMPPVKPEAWTGVMDTLTWSPEAPQGPHTEIPEVAATIPSGLTIGEDCLRLNVWTNGLDDARRPVMVWLHGGGFTSGNGNYTMYDGENMARKRDVVTVSINHRLNSFGFAYLAGIGGEEFADSGNAGVLDIVAALEWVRDNIAKFGGDPNNVTIFGQSGGAGKVSTLLAMPPAQGLFHRAIIQSGSNVSGISKEAAVKNVQALMASVGVKTAEELQQVPMEALVKATLGARGVQWGPVVDGKTLPRGPFDPTAPEISANVPVLIGTTEHEVTFFPDEPLEPIDDAQLLARIKEAARANDAQASKLIDVYRAGRPGVSNIDLALILESDARFRQRVLTQAERKSEQPAPVYMYYFTWKSPVRDGKLKAFHTLEIPFAIENVDEAQSMTGMGEDRYALQDKMSAAWAAFARTGNPNHAGLPNWPAFKLADRATMFLDTECKVVNNPHAEELRALFALTA